MQKREGVAENPQPLFVIYYTRIILEGETFIDQFHCALVAIFDRQATCFDGGQVFVGEEFGGSNFARIEGGFLIFSRTPFCLPMDVAPFSS